MKVREGTEFYRVHTGLLLACMCLVLMSGAGSGSVKLVSLTALALCLFLLFRGEITAGLPALLGILLFCICCWVSAYRTFGDISIAYAANFPFYLLFYLLLSSLGESERSMLRRFCVLWAEIVSAAGIIHYIYRSFTADPVRLGFIPGNPNMLGIFLVMALLLLSEFEKENVRSFITGFKPLLVCALVLTLSMGSFLAFILALIYILAADSRERNFKAAFSDLVKMLAGLLAYAVPGVLMIISAYSGRPYLTVLSSALCPVLCYYSKAMGEFFEKGRRALLFIILLGIPAGILLIYLRPTAADTFAERLGMIRNGWRYFTENPLEGVGMYRWRELNRSDWDMDYKSWHIHNAPVHVAAEMGIFALISLIIWAAGLFSERKNREAAPVFAAYYFHCLMDVSFFHMGPGCMFMSSVCRGKGKCRIPAAAVRISALLLAAFYLHAMIIRT